MPKVSREVLLKFSQSPEHALKVIHILRQHNENLTENSNGYFFDYKKLKGSTMNDLADFFKRESEFLEESDVINFINKPDEIVAEESSEKNTVSDQLTTIKVSQKFLNEYTADAEKTSGKPLSFLKFVNCKKRYIRNPETLLSKNESPLKKEEYLLQP